MNIKNILYATMIGAACAGFTACDDDNGSNPTLTVPESFLLNTPVLSENPIDLEETSDSIALYWSQPNYGGFPAVTTYNVQYALSDNFDELIQRQEENEEFVGVIQMDEPLNVCNTAFAPSDFNRNLIKLAGVSSVDELPEEMDVFFRIVAKTYSTEPIYSNIVKIKVQPFFQALQAADPVLWYLTGNAIGDGSWNSDHQFGCVPMYFSPNETYNELDGTGNIVWAGYLVPDGFKFRGSTTDNWATQIGQGDAFGEYKLNDGGSANISVPEAGVYFVKLNTQTHVPEITLYEGRWQTFQSISVSGTFNEWADTEMEPVNTAAAENHDWYLNIDLKAGDEIKFKQTGTWDFNWGWGNLINLSAGYYGIGAQNGGNFYISEDGNYDIYFNDLLGMFRFVRL